MPRCIPFKLHLVCVNISLYSKPRLTSFINLESQNMIRTEITSNLADRVPSPEGVTLRLAIRPPDPHSARFALSPRPNRANEGGIQSDYLAVRLDAPDACGCSRLLECAVVSRALRRASCRSGGQTFRNQINNPSVESSDRRGEPLPKAGSEVACDLGCYRRRAVGEPLRSDD